MTAAAAVTAANLPGLPGLPSNALTDTLGYLHAHPQLRSALITFLKADSTKEFLATVTQLAIKIKPQEVAALVSHHHTKTCRACWYVLGMHGTCVRRQSQSAGCTPWHALVSSMSPVS